MQELSRENLRLRRVSEADQSAFLNATRKSRELHQPWIFPPVSAQAFRDWVKDDPRRERYLVWHGASAESQQLVGYVGINELTWGVFENGCLGYWATAAHAGQGHLGAALSLLIGHVFSRQPRRLHRLEANVQPTNEASRRLVQGLGFRLEGLSPRFLKLGGSWRDHERWAITREDWRASPRARRPVAPRQ